MNQILKPRTGGLLALALAIAVLPMFFPNAFYYDVAIKAGIAAIVCVGLNLLIGYAGQISLGHAGFFGLGVYFSAILTSGNHFVADAGLLGVIPVNWRVVDKYEIEGVLAQDPVLVHALLDVPPLLALVIGAAFVGLFAYLIARPILRLRGHYLAMATLGMGIIIAIVLRTEIAITGGPDGMAARPLTVAGWSPPGDLAWYALVGAVLWLTVWLALNLIDSPVGRALRSVHSSETAAQVSGIDTTRYKVLVFVVSAVIASIAGSLFAHFESFATPGEAGFLESIRYVTMVVLGGMASTFGAVVGAGIISVLPQLIAGVEEYEMLLFGLILMLVMIYLPRGLVPSLAVLAGRLAEAASRSQR